jgi:exosortase
MRSVNTDNAVFAAQIFGVPFQRSGYHIQLPALLLYVDESCSGIRYLISYVVFGLAYALLYKKKTVSRFLVIVSILPISIFASSMRLFVIFLAAYYIGAWTIDRVPHVLLSWSVFGAVLTAAVGLDWKFSRYWEKLPVKT